MEILIIILLFGLHANEVFSNLYFATFRDCNSNNSNEVEHMNLAGGQQFSLCCFATDFENCESFEYNLNIQASPTCKNVVHNNTLLEGRCFTQAEFLLELNGRDEDLCRFQCAPTNDLNSVYYRVRIYSLLPPAEQELTEIQTSETGELNMTVTSHIGVLQYNYKYQISMILSNSSRLPLSTEQCNKSICYFTMAIILDLSSDNVTIVFNVSNPMYSILYNKSVNLIAAIVPGCVEDLSLFQETLTSSEAVIKFRPSKAILKLSPFMADVGKPLVYQIVLNKSSGAEKEVTQFEIIKTVFQHNRTNQYVVVKFQQLSAFMTYTVSIRGQAGGGNGCLKTLTFTTQKAVPSTPPYLDDFSFSRHRRKDTIILRLMWKPLSADVAGGVNVTYDVQIQPGNIPITGIQQTYIEVSVPDTPQDIHVWSRNEMGRSNNFTKILIHNINESLVLDTSLVIDFLNSTTALAFLHLPTTAYVQELTFQWCYLTLNSSCTLQCQDYPEYVLTNASRTEPFLIHYNLNSRPQSTTEDILVEYFDLEDENETLIDGKHAHAKKARLSGLTCPRPLVQCQNTTSSYPKFFVSMKMNNSWSGMVPAKCYFTRQSKSGRFTVQWYNQTTLELQQNCSECSPNQFLIKSYKIYASESEVCTQTKDTWQANSSIFTQTFFSIQTLKRFICVQAFGDDNLVDFQPKWVEVSHTAELPSSSPAITIVLVITIVASLGIIAAVATYCSFHQCRKRKKYFHQMMVTGIISDENLSTEESSLPQEKKINVYKSTESKLNSEMSSTDSGHLTISSSNSDFTPQKLTKCDSPDVPNTSSTIDSGLNQSQGVEDVQSLQENVQSQRVEDVQSMQESLQSQEEDDVLSIQESLQSQEVDDGQSIHESLESQELDDVQPKQESLQSQEVDDVQFIQDSLESQKVDVQLTQETLLQSLGLTFQVSI